MEVYAKETFESGFWLNIFIYLQWKSFGETDDLFISVCELYAC